VQLRERWFWHRSPLVRRFYRRSQVASAILSTREKCTRQKKVVGSLGADLGAVARGIVTLAFAGGCQRRGAWHVQRDTRPDAQV
jgi:hypothetical protein